MKSPCKRCINIDWLEVYALEPITESPHDAEYFRSAGFTVRERDYGTPVYHEMFTLYGTDGLPLIEVRRNPKSAIGRQEHGVLDPLSTHIRLCNRTCYFDDAAELMQKFLDTYHYHLCRISRLDLCLDFEYFDYGDEPQKFLNRYINGKYSKINQANISLHGLDCWDGRYWNSVRWGTPKSMVVTRFYDKTMELQQVHDKPYIRQAWYASGLVDDWRTLEKYDESGQPYKPRIWRVEFAIRSSEKNWFVVENPYNTKPKLRSIKHRLECYFTRAQMLDVFLSLVHHYFHFKKVEYIKGSKDDADRQLQRKDRCADKKLFDLSGIQQFYKLTTVNTSEAASKSDERLLRYLYAYLSQSIDPKVNKALYIVIEKLEQRIHTEDRTGEIDEATIKIMRLLIQRRMQHRDATFEDDLQTIKNYIENEPDIFA